VRTEFNPAQVPQESGGLPVERFGEVEMVAVVHSAQQLGDGGQFGDPPL